MRKADRLFQIIQILRRMRRPATADEIAAELEVSKRTLYRDIADLIGQRVPIRGEAGIGYVLDGGFDLPPLMLTESEVEAAVLGAQLVAAQGDPTLKKAAEDLIAKIVVSVPERLRPYILEPSTGAPPSYKGVRDSIDMARLRAQIRTGCKVSLSYRDEQGRTSERIIWPVAVGYLDTVRLVAAWCELRRDFRHFRTDRVVGASFLDERYPDRPASLRGKWLAQLKARARPRP
ncbi:MAG: YafY family protein [Alphaproteobacteria bacterium]